MSQHIDEQFALALAGQVSVGLTPGEGQSERMFGALTTIGLMLRNSSDSELVQQTLDLIARSEVTQYDEHGSTTFETRIDDDA